MSGVCACHGGLGRGRAGFAVPQSILGSIPGISVTAVVYAWRGLEMAGKWRHVARLRDPFVRGTVGGRFKKAESERGGGGGERRRKKRKSKKSQKKKKKKKGGPFANHLTVFFRAVEMLRWGLRKGRAPHKMSRWQCWRPWRRLQGREGAFGGIYCPANFIGAEPGLGALSCRAATPLSGTAAP